MVIWFKVPIGTTTITCKTWDESENEATASFTITVTSPQYTIEFTSGSAYNSACEGTNSCMSPYQLDIPVDSVVRFMNNDNAAHTTVSGNTITGSSGHWTSSLITSGQSFEHTFTQSGTYEYYDSVHTHIKGKIVVGNDSTVKTGSSVDTTPPVVNVPNDITVTTHETYQGSIPNEPLRIRIFEFTDEWQELSPSATDNVNLGNNNVYCSAESIHTTTTNPTGDPFLHHFGYSPIEAVPSHFTVTWWPVGTTTVTCTATDAAGNTGSASFDVTVTAQTTTTSSSLNSYTEPHSGFIFKYPNMLDGIQIISMQTVDDYGVCDNCVSIEYTIKNTLDEPIRKLHLSNQGYVVSNSQNVIFHNGGVATPGYTSGYVMNVSNWNDEIIDPGETVVLSTRVTWTGLPSNTGWPCGSLNSGQTWSSGECEVHMTEASIDLVESWQNTIFSGSGPEIIITSQTTTVDRDGTCVPVAINYQNLSSNAKFMTRTPDGVEREFGSFSTNAFPGYIESNACADAQLHPFSSFVYIVDDGVTRGELEFQIIGGVYTPATNSTSTQTTFDANAPVVNLGACIGYTQVCMTGGDINNGVSSAFTGSTLPNINVLTANGTAPILYSAWIDNGSPNESFWNSNYFGQNNDAYNWKPDAYSDHCTYPSYYPFPVGVTTVTCTATNDEGNSASASFTVTVTSSQTTFDVNAPVVNLGACIGYTQVCMTGGDINNGVSSAFTGSTLPNINVLTANGTAPILYSAWIDNGSPNESFWNSNYFGQNNDAYNWKPDAYSDHCTYPSYYPFPVGVTTVTCTATNDEGNSASASFTVTVTSSQTTSEPFVEIAQGSSSAGCEPNCFIPSTITIPADTSLVFKNMDSKLHTTTSGTKASGPSEHWNSLMTMTSGSSFSTPELEQGTYHYFCMIHPWMEGKVIVGNGSPIKNCRTISRNNRYNTTNHHHFACS